MVLKNLDHKSILEQPLRPGNSTRRKASSIFIMVALLFGVFYFCCGCSKCGKDDQIAKLISLQNAVSRDFAKSVGKWQTAANGDLFAIGDGLKTEKGATAKLQLFPEGQMMVESDTIVRFQNSPGEQAGQRVQVETGSIEIESGEIDLQVHTIVGLSIIEKGSRVRIHSTDEGSSFDVLVGQIEVDSQGKKVAVSKGKKLELDVGGVIIDEPEEEPVPEEVVAEPESEQSVEEEVVAEDATEEGVDPYKGSAPKFADLTIPLSESATIHDPNPPTNVRIAFKSCKDGGLLEVGRRRNRNYRYATTRGQEAGIVRLPPGGYRYRVRCLDGGKPQRGVAGNGWLYVIKDPGVRRLPKSVPTVIVDADGRSYTVRYQNRLPKITFRWPDPAVANSYRVYISPDKGKEIKKKSSRPTTTFGSGKLKEGVHNFYFATPDGRKSPRGTLRIVFDNRARTAHLQEPIEGKPKPGQQVRIKGTALTQSSVSVSGKEVSIDTSGRFEYDTIAPTSDKAISIRVKHRTSKIHYYLRHVADDS